MTASDYRQIRRLLAAPATAALVTAAEERYVLSRTVLLRVSGPGIVPGCAGIFTGLDDGVYTLRAAAGPQQSPAGKLPGRAVRGLLGRLRSVAAWQPVTAASWVLVNGPCGGPAQVLARRDGDGISRATAVSAAVWKCWHAAWQVPGRGQTLHAWQPDGRPAHALKMSVSSAHAGTWTAGYIMPVILSDLQLRDASYLVRASGPAPARTRARGPVQVRPA